MLSLCGTEATLSFSAGPVCSSFSAEACAILHTLCWSRQHQQVCHFSSLLLLFDSRSVLATLSSSQFFLLPQSSWQIWQELSSLSCSIRLQWVPRHSFLPGNDVADEPARRGALLAPSAIHCSLSPFISRIHSCLFSDWRRTVSSKFFDTQISSISTEEFVLSRHARCVLSRLRCNGHSLPLSSCLSRIGRIENPCCGRLWTPVPGHLSSHSSLSSYGFFAPFTLWQLSVSLRPLVQTLGSCPASGAPWSFAMLPSLKRGRVTTTTTTTTSLFCRLVPTFTSTVSPYRFKETVDGLAREKQLRHYALHNFFHYVEKSSTFICGSHCCAVDNAGLAG